MANPSSGTTSPTNDEQQLGDEYEVDIVYPHEHNGSGFCYDPTCPDKENQENIQALGQAVQSGLVTPSEADRIYRGKNV